MLLMRGIEERAMTLYRQGKVPGSFYDGFGQEAVSAGATFAMAAAGPPVHPAPRPRARTSSAASSRGAILAQYMGRDGGITGGRDGNVHFGDRTLGCVGMVSMLPDMMLVATGMAMAFKLRGEQRCAITWFGDGSTSRGDFHEAMNWAGVQRLPVIFVLENNQYAYSTPLRPAVRGRPGRARRRLRLPGRDGRRQRRRGGVRGDARSARERALAGEGPTLIEAVTMRMHGHAAHDDMRYVPDRAGRGVAREGPDRPPGARACEALGVDVAGAARRGQGRDRRGRRARRWQSPMPDPTTALDGVFATTRPSLLGDGDAPWSRLRGAESPMATMTYLQAISDAMREEMRADERVFVMGEDIGAFGGAFKVTDGFIDEFGAERVMDTPLAESAIVGTADRRRRRRACARSARCSSPTSSPAASTSSSTSPARCTTGMGLSVPITVRLPERRRLLRRPVPLAEPRGVVHARARA